jgi:5-methylcytosine-specific restriction enzyme subunit McrC
VTHVTIHEWGHARFGEDGLTREHAHAPHAAACYAPLAHALLFRTAEMMLIYPGNPGQGCSERAQFGIAGGRERLRITAADVSVDERVPVEALRA